MTRFGLGTGFDRASRIWGAATAGPSACRGPAPTVCSLYYTTANMLEAKASALKGYEEAVKTLAGQHQAVDLSEALADLPLHSSHIQEHVWQCLATYANQMQAADCLSLACENPSVVGWQVTA